MVRRVLDASIVNTAVLCVLLSVRVCRAFTAGCARGFAGSALFSLRLSNNRSGKTSSTAPRPQAICGTQRTPRQGSFVAMPSLSLSTLALPCKRHRNTFLLPRQERGDPASLTAERGVGANDMYNGDGPLALVVLNTKGDCESKGLLRHLWRRAAVRVCADGGANRLHDSFDSEPPEERARFVPDLIVGDLDSLRPEVAAFYKDLGSEVKLSADQDHNDFEKCLIEVKARLLAEITATADEVGEEKTENTPATHTESTAALAATVVGLGAFGGRFDHEMAGISLLHAYTSCFGRFVLMGAGNVAFLLVPGLTHVVEPDERFEGPTVGLIPVGGACRSVNTEGLKWNLEGGSLEFGVLVSSSNCVVEKEVRVTTDAPLVWTAEFKAAEWIAAVGSGEACD